MSTRTSTLVLQNNTDAEFRAWAQEIHDSLAAFGWVNTADTGQINLTTVSKPAGVSASQGYEIWRMADALQATIPVYMKIEYGSGSGAAIQMGLWITVGTASNGTGTLTGQLSARTQFFGPLAGDATGRACFSSGTTSRFSFALSASTVSINNYFYFGVERTKDAAGADSNEGMHVVMVSQQNSSAAGFVTHQAIPFTGSIPLVELFLTGDFPTSAQATGVYGSDVETYAVKPALFYPRNPIMNWVVYYSADLTSGVPITLSIYGASHTYVPCGNVSTSCTFLTQRGATTARLAMRYE